MLKMGTDIKVVHQKIENGNKFQKMQGNLIQKANSTIERLNQGKLDEDKFAQMYDTIQADLKRMDDTVIQYTDSIQTLENFIEKYSPL